MEMKVFYLSLLDTSLPFSRDCIKILERLKDKNIFISLTVSGAVLTPKSLAFLSSLNVRELLLDASSLPEVKSAVEGIKATGCGMQAGVSFNLRKDNYQDIPEVVSLCLDGNIKSLVFPMQRLAESGGAFYLTAKDREDLGAILSSIRHDPLKIIIHDPFLWRLFYPGRDFPQGGCQAANTMAYISPKGLAYPCPTMPVQLGDVMTQKLTEILSSELKRETRKAIIMPPHGCGQCGELSRCMGGCRGRAYVLKGSLGEFDPACA